MSKKLKDIGTGLYLTILVLAAGYALAMAVTEAEQDRAYCRDQGLEYFEGHCVIPARGGE